MKFGHGVFLHPVCMCVCVYIYIYIYYIPIPRNTHVGYVPFPWARWRVNSNMEKVIYKRTFLKYSFNNSNLVVNIGNSNWQQSHNPVACV